MRSVPLPVRRTIVRRRSRSSIERCASPSRSSVLIIRSPDDSGTPAPVVMRANEALRAALAQKDVIDGLAVMGLEVKSSTPQELGALLKSSYDRWGPIVKKIGFTADS